MSVFENIAINDDGIIVNNEWIEWSHFSIPNKPQTLRNIMRKLMAFFGHCNKCTALDGCYLLETNRPFQPLHPNCDCKKKNITIKKVQTLGKAELSIIKLTNYIFTNKEQSKGKKNIFQSWGYSLEDANEIKIQIENQAKTNYTKGNYVLKNLDKYGQRLAIPIELKGNKFYSGWMLEPEGRIRNITPFGGWVK